jgi:hypothetical protein
MVFSKDRLLFDDVAQKIDRFHHRYVVDTPKLSSLNISIGSLDSGRLPLLQNKVNHMPKYFLFYYRWGPDV